MKRHENIAQILEYFNRLESKVRLSNSIGLTDVNSNAEDFFASLLNKVFGFNLTNLNLKKLNFPAIDLADPSERICFQVTSQYSKAKVQKTLDRFRDHKLYDAYDSLRFVIISSSTVRAKATFTLGVLKRQQRNRS